jgi:transposase
MGNRRYDEEFKREAVRLAVEEKRSQHSVEKSLGIGNGVLKDWVAKSRQHNSADSTGIKDAHEAKIRELEKQLAQVTREREILKKALAIFSKEPNPYSGS